MIQSNSGGSALRGLLILFGVLMAMAIVAGMLATWLSGYTVSGSRSFYLVQSVVQNLVMFCGTGYATWRIISPDPLKNLGLSGGGCSWRPYAGVVIVLLLGMPLLNQIIHYNSEMTFPAGLESWLRGMEEAGAEVTRIILDAPSAGSLVTGVLFVGVLTGLSEEFLFRGTLQNLLVKRGHMRAAAIWVTAIIFSAVHLQFYGFFPRVLLGAFFGYVLYWSGSLWPAVFAHALNNSLVVVFTWLEARGTVTADIENLGVIRGGIPWWAILSLVMLIIFFRYGTHYFFINTKAQTLDNGLKIRNR